MPYLAMNTRTRSRPPAIARARPPSRSRFSESAPSSDRTPKSKSEVKKWRISTTAGRSRTDHHGTADRVEDLPGQRREIRLARRPDERLLERIRTLAREVR